MDESSKNVQDDIGMSMEKDGDEGCDDSKRNGHFLRNRIDDCRANNLTKNNIPSLTSIRTNQGAVKKVRDDKRIFENWRQSNNDGTAGGILRSYDRKEKRMSMETHDGENSRINERLQKKAINSWRANNSIENKTSIPSNQGAVLKETRWRSRQVRKIDLELMENLLAKEPNDIMMELQQITDELEEFLESGITPDCLVLSLHVLTKMSSSNFIENLSELLKIIVGSRYMDKLILFVYNLSDQTDEEKQLNNFFWNNVDEFWLNLSVFCINIIDKMPATGRDVLPRVLNAVTQIIPSFESKFQIIQDVVKDNFENIQLNLAKLSKKKSKAFFNSEENEDDEEPPEDFRDIPIYPLPHELFHDDKVFLRKNKIEGKYKDVEHYLDVQFRLLREDFVSPLRQGIQEYLSPDHKKRLSNIKVYKDVMCIKMEKSQSQMGFLMQVFKKGKIKNVERSKRFMFGALVCFTPDNFQTITFGKILDQKIDYLRNGQILVGFENHVQFNSKIVYTMVECMVYFEPYYQVLKALQNMSSYNFPLKQYLVDVQHEREFPGYINENTYFKIKYYDVHQQKLQIWCVSLTNTADWSNLRLNLNKSQIIAFRNALCSKLSIIQGPPGTGKTYLGLEIAKTLILNNNIWRNGNHPMLVICYTNHALDQFLEGLLSTTNKIVRVGGQSKNENLAKYNIRNLRYNTRYNKNYDIDIDDIDIDYIDTDYIDTDDDSDLVTENKTRTRQRLVINEISETLHYWTELHSRIINSNVVINPRVFSKMSTRNWFTFYNKNSFIDWLLEIPTNYKQDGQNNPIMRQEEEDEIEIFFEYFNEYLNRDYVELKIFLNLMVKLEDMDDFLDKTSENYYELRMLHQKAKDTYNYLKYQLDVLGGHLRNGVEIQLPPNFDYKNLENLKCEYRWQLYGYCVQNLMKWASKLIKINDESYRNANRKYTEICDIVDTRIMKKNLVIGMTTTGAARLQSLLQTLECPIVIVEEAAEVLESHIITSLTENCQQLILIGDHKQLKPTTADYYLDRDFNLGTSLFERMVRNDLHCDTLNEQHRMRPEIARLLCPNIYKDLKNHESVDVYPQIKGVDKSVFFITHQYKEIEASDNSKENHHEAKYLILLARYLILNNYGPEQITILVAYSGQFFACLEEKRNYDILDDVKICVLDNYQGEENDIILLSLVRNNDEGLIGFLKLENRVCVALSRAKQGLYIMGNINHLANNSGVWKPIKAELESMNAIGKSLPLYCQKHNNYTYIKEISDFQKVSDGGCSQPCNMLLDCGHRCPKNCHIISHDTVQCFQDCSRILCEENHQCPKKCYEECGECTVPIKALLLCGHSNFISCSQKLEEAKCLTDVQTTLPCGHSVEKQCYMAPEKFQCPFPCEAKIEACGHTCLKKCHYFKDPNHIRHFCEKPCERVNTNCLRPEGEHHKCKELCYVKCKPCDVLIKKKRTGCSHLFLVKCFQNIDDTKCEKPCKRELACGHHCKLKCYQSCSNYQCKVMVDKEIEECGHTVKFMCFLDPVKSACEEKCKKILPCGHKCQLKCNEICSSKFCNDLVESNIQSPCGHVFDKPCYLRNETTISNELLSFCKAKCNTILDCKHLCSGTCGECSQGRIHKECQENCKNIFICGHECTVSCRLTCLPCQQPCAYRCIHKKCSKKCGVSCTRCVEPCQRKCQHGACKAKCFEKCTIEPCMGPCQKLLKCGHPCIGFCGDPCPPLCRICDKEEVTDIFFGTEDEEDARFVYLHDCKHVVESEGLEQFFLQNSGNNDREIAFICCPKCKTQITQIQRYSDLLKESFKDIQIVNKMIRGSNNDEHQKRLLKEAVIISKQYKYLFRVNSLDSCKAINWLNTLLKKLQSKDDENIAMISKTDELQAVESKLLVFNNIMKNTTEFLDLSVSGKQLLLQQINFLISSLSDCKSMTKQKIMDFESELNRLKRIEELSIMEKSSAHLQEFKDLCNVAFSFKPYNNEDDILLQNLLIDLNEKSDSSLKCIIEDANKD